MSDHNNNDDSNKNKNSNGEEGEDEDGIKEDDDEDGNGDEDSFPLLFASRNIFNSLSRIFILASDTLTWARKTLIKCDSSVSPNRR